MKNFNLRDYLNELETLVNIDSGSRVPGGTSLMADYMEAKYRELGLTVKRIESEKGLGPCLEIRNHAEREKIDVLFLGHMDTVFPAGEPERRPYREEGELGYGPGIMDMKAGLLSTWYLVKNLVEDGTGLNICVAHNSDEEISSLDSQEWIKKLAEKADITIVMEPGRKNGEYVNERKGLARYTVTVEGVAAHAGIAPQDGASAIYELAELILKLQALNNYEIGTSVNVGVISGGTASNVVCDLATCVVDTRFDTIGEHEKIEESLKRLESRRVNPRTSVTIVRDGFRPPMNKTEKTEALMALMEEHAAPIGMDMKWVKTGGGSDGNFAAFAGSAVIDGAGPAGDGAHGKKESLQLNTIEPRLELLYNMLTALSEKRG